MILAEYDPDKHADFLDIDECADRMGLSVHQVWDLVERGALRSFRLGHARMPLVQPAITNVEPISKGK